MDAGLKNMTTNSIWDETMAQLIKTTNFCFETKAQRGLVHGVLGFSNVFEDTRAHGGSHAWTLDTHMYAFTHIKSNI